MNLEVHYVPGKENTVADVLSYYRYHVEGTDGQPEGNFSLADASVARCVREWLAVVAKHVGFDEYVKAAVESLSKGLQLASFGFTKCGATHLDSDNFEHK